MLAEQIQQMKQAAQHVKEATAGYAARAQQAASHAGGMVSDIAPSRAGTEDNAAPAAAAAPAAKASGTVQESDMAAQQQRDQGPQLQMSPSPLEHYQQARVHEQEQTIITGVDAAPVTLQRRVPPADLNKALPHPEVPRANLAVSRECPAGSAANTNRNLSVMQQHVAFFDRDADKVIWPSDTFVGFRKLGFGLIISSLAVPVVHGTFSYATCPSWIPDPFMRIYMDRMDRTKHGSDSETFDTEGRFVPDKFEAIFSKFDKGNKEALSWQDINTMILANRNVMDPVGWVAERLEWWTTYMLCADDKGLVSKEKLRQLYDGSLFYTMAEERATQRQSPRDRMKLE